MVFGRAYSVRDVVLYVVDRLGGVRGLKKLMKLVFLVEFESCGSRCIRRYLVGGRPATRASFVIWDYGPFSKDVYEVLDDESLFDVADPTPPVLLTLTAKGRETARRAAERLPKGLKTRVDGVLRRYGLMDGGSLARLVYRMLDLDEVVKEEYIGSPVESYLKDRRFKIETVEI